MELVWDAGFKRAYRKRIAPDQQLADRFSDAITRFVADPFDPRLRTHKLTGKLQGYWALQ
jgi:mRNA-degrading endonuclease YafQ of YafQ-DinJ toxin-antitoxin module